MNSFHNRLFRPFLMAALAGISTYSGVAQAQQLIGFDGGNADNARSLTTDSAGNIYVGGMSRNHSKPIEFAVVKHSAQGALQWFARLQPGAGYFAGEALDVAADSAGNAYAVGYVLKDPTAFRPTVDWVVASFDSRGAQRWSHVYSATNLSLDQAVKVVFDPRGSIYVAGLSGTDTDISWLIAKYSLTGTLLWQRTVNGPAGFDRVIGAQLDPQGNFFVAGAFSTNGVAFEDDAHLVKVDPNGIVLWGRTFSVNADSHEEPADLAVDAAGNPYITGISFTSGSPEGPAVPFLTKYDPSGNLAFALTGPTAGGVSVATHSGGVVTSGGGTDESGQTGGTFISKFNSSGQLIWATPIGSAGKIAVDSKDNVFLGTSVFAPAGSAYQILKLNSSGQQVLDLIEPAGNVLNDVTLSSSGDFLVTGNTSNFLADILTVRVPQGAEPPTLPDAPSGLVLTPGKSRLTLNWADNANNESGYRIERSINGGAFVEIAQVSANANHFVNTGLNRKFTYSYRVRAFNGAGNSGYSNIATGKPR